ncbi:hypothetical protein HYQ44_002964 [Verticillium longisporum]|nr:hypothetical protein HYQ44_002964 [Verticillium longisporum]
MAGRSKGCRGSSLGTSSRTVTMPFVRISLLASPTMRRTALTVSKKMDTSRLMLGFELENKSRTRSLIIYTRACHVFLLFIETRLSTGCRLQVTLQLLGSIVRQFQLVVQVQSLLDLGLQLELEQLELLRHCN